MYKKITDEKLGETNYEINEFGVVRNIETGKEISQQEHNGYKVVSLSKDGIDIKRRVNRLVAIAFLSKNDFKCMPGEKREAIDLESLEVNHKDLNKSNNRLDNLEWCTQEYNRWHGYTNNINYARKKAVIGVNIKTKEIIKFDSLYMAGKYLSETKKEQEINQKCNCIRNTCNRKQKDTHGFYWFWYNEDIINDPEKYIEEILKTKNKYSEVQKELIKKNKLSDAIIKYRVKNYNLSIDEAIALPKSTRLKFNLKENKEWNYEPNKNSKAYKGLYKQYGNLTPIEIIKEKGKKVKYRCKCTCGGELITQYTNVLNGKTKKCVNCR